jgi:hypothetical protein
MLCQEIKRIGRYMVIELHVGYILSFAAYVEMVRAKYTI